MSGKSWKCKANKFVMRGSGVRIPSAHHFSHFHFRAEIAAGKPHDPLAAGVYATHVFVMKAVDFDTRIRRGSPSYAA
jgi:hypothetical protein